MNLSEATWTDVRDHDGRLAFLPVGATEQHGPHAPLGTDALNAVAVAEAGAETVAARSGAGGGDDEDGEGNGDVDRSEPVVAPPVHVGVSEEHRAFDGTLWVSPDAFRRYVRETAESLVAAGFDRLVLVNGHGGNVEALAEVARRLSRDDGASAGAGAHAVAFTWFEAVGDHTSDMGHAGPLETALLRHANPELVREARVEAAATDAAARWGEWVAGVNLAHDSDEFTDNGVVGDPTAGDADRGAELLDRAASSLADLAAAVAERE
ncbi:MAG: creatininase family protein [Halolamina sp.]